MKYFSHSFIDELDIGKCNAHASDEANRSLVNQDLGLQNLIMIDNYTSIFLVGTIKWKTKTPLHTILHQPIKHFLSRVSRSHPVSTPERLHQSMKRD